MAEASISERTVATTPCLTETTSPTHQYRLSSSTTGAWEEAAREKTPTTTRIRSYCTVLQQVTQPSNRPITTITVGHDKGMYK